MTIGVKKDIEFVDVVFDPHESGRKDLPRVYSTRSITYTETRIDGCRELIENIAVYRDRNNSINLWCCLLWIIGNKCPGYRSLSSMLRGRCYYFYRTSRAESFISSDAIALRESAWVCNNNGEFVRPDEIARSEWPSFYPCDSIHTADLFEFLGVKDSVEEMEQEDDSNLTDAQRERIALADILRKNGISDLSDLQELLEIKRQRDNQKQEEANRFDSYSDASADHDRTDESGTRRDTSEDEIFEEFEEDSSDANSENSRNSDETEEPGESRQDQTKEKKKRTIDKTTKNIVKDILRRSKDNAEASDSSNKSTKAQSDQDEDDVDQDELIPQSVDYSKKIERAKEKSAAELDRIVHFQDLQDKVVNAEKYSFGWLI